MPKIIDFISIFAAVMKGQVRDRPGSLHRLQSQRKEVTVELSQF